MRKQCVSVHITDEGCEIGPPVMRTWIIAPDEPADLQREIARKNDAIRELSITLQRNTGRLLVLQKDNDALIENNARLQSDIQRLTQHLKRIEDVVAPF